MSLSARECRERAMEARALARSARTMAAWTACEQVADYWLVLAERVEHEQPQGIRVAPSPSASRTVYPDTMPILGYCLAVGVALFLGLMALSASFDPGRADDAPSASSRSMAPATASLLPARSAASGQSDWR
jgi:hypothetical protein